MSRPDLSSPEGLAAYRAELRRVALPVRLLAFAVIIVGAFLLIGIRYGWLGLTYGQLTPAYGVIGLGWVLMLVAIFVRTRYHRRRMSEAAPDGPGTGN